MKINVHGNLKFITFDHISNTDLVNHAFTTRCGGVSSGNFSTLNLGLSRDDNKRDVLENYKIIAKSVGFDIENIVFSNQIHADHVHVATEIDRGNGILRKSTIFDTDAFITNTKNVVLQTFHADCVPVFLLDPVKKVAGVVHAGWKGTLIEISSVTVKKMMDVFDTNPKDVLAGIGPSIGPTAFEVDEDVMLQFENRNSEFKKFIKASENNKYFIDLWEINKYSLINAGVQVENIEISGLCTFSDKDMFYSHRAMGDDRGTMSAFIELK